MGLWEGQLGCNLRNVAFRRRFLDEHSIKILIQNHVVMTKLDYCNSICYNLPNYQVKKLQPTMTGAAEPWDVCLLTTEQHCSLTDIALAHKMCVPSHDCWKTCFLKKVVATLWGQYKCCGAARSRWVGHWINLPRCNSSVMASEPSKCEPQDYIRPPVQVKVSNGTDRHEVITYICNHSRSLHIFTIIITIK